MNSVYTNNYVFNDSTGEAYTADMGNSMEDSRAMLATLIANSFLAAGGVVWGGGSSVLTDTITLTSGVFAKPNFVDAGVEVPGVFYCEGDAFTCVNGDYIIARLSASVTSASTIVTGSYVKTASAPVSDTDVVIAQYTGGNFVFNEYASFTTILNLKAASSAQTIARLLNTVFLTPASLNDAFPDIKEISGVSTIGLTSGNPAFRFANGDTHPTNPASGYTGGNEDYAMKGDILTTSGGGITNVYTGGVGGNYQIFGNTSAVLGGGTRYKKSLQTGVGTGANNAGTGGSATLTLSTAFYNSGNLSVLTVGIDTTTSTAGAYYRVSVHFGAVGVTSSLIVDWENISAVNDTGGAQIYIDIDGWG